MSRIRTIKPEFCESESIGRVSRDARLLFVQLWTIVDDAGRTRAAPKMLAGRLYPYDEDISAREIDGWLAELEREGCIARYQVGGGHYLQVTNWSKHQKIDHPTKSKLPGPDETITTVSPSSPESLTNNSRETRESLAPDLGPGPGPGPGEEKNQEYDSSLRSESAPAAPSVGELELSAPAHVDAKHAVWTEGVLTLEQLSVPEPKARKMIGKWLRDTRNDAHGILDAIRLARDARTLDPIPYVTTCLKTEKSDGKSFEGGGSVAEAADELARRTAAGLDLPPRPF